MMISCYRPSSPGKPDFCSSSPFLCIRDPPHASARQAHLQNCKILSICLERSLRLSTWQNSDAETTPLRACSAITTHTPLKNMLPSSLLSCWERSSHLMLVRYATGYSSNADFILELRCPSSCLAGQGLRFRCRIVNVRGSFQKGLLKQCGCRIPLQR